MLVLLILVMLVMLVILVMIGDVMVDEKEDVVDTSSKVES